MLPKLTTLPTYLVELNINNCTLFFDQGKLIGITLNENGVVSKAVLDYKPEKNPQAWHRLNVLEPIATLRVSAEKFEAAVWAMLKTAV